jgi:hypothetical protein
MKTELTAYNDIIHVVNVLYKGLKLAELEKKTKGRKLAVPIPTILAYGIFKQAFGIETKKSVYKLLNPGCSYKTFVVNLNRFAPLAAMILAVILQINCMFAHPIKYSDSTDIAVCLPQHARSHKTMKLLASWGGTSTGTFYGIKLHITTDFNRKLLKVRFASGRVDERDVFPKMNADLEGIFVCDAGYLRKSLQRAFYREGKRIMIVKPRNNMKKLMTKFEEWLYNGRMTIELSFRSLKMFYGLVTSLPRSVEGYLANYTYALLAYCLA